MSIYLNDKTRTVTEDAILGVEKSGVVSILRRFSDGPGDDRKLSRALFADNNQFCMAQVDRHKKTLVW